MLPTKRENRFKSKILPRCPGSYPWCYFEAVLWLTPQLDRNCLYCRGATYRCICAMRLPHWRVHLPGCTLLIWFGSLQSCLNNNTFGYVGVWGRSGPRYVAPWNYHNSTREAHFCAFELAYIQPLNQEYLALTPGTCSLRFPFPDIPRHKEVVFGID